MAERTAILLGDEPVTSLDDYIQTGGTEGLTAALELEPDEIIAEIKAAGLRGRGGAGFPTGTKWQSVRSSAAEAGSAQFVCNAAEGEPGTFKDRWLMRANPYQVIEGMAIGAFAVGAQEATIALKRRFEPELAAIRRAIEEMTDAGFLGTMPIEVLDGPDEYLFGEEKAMLEVIEGNLPMPRILPPYQEGLFATSGSPNPTAVNNVETLANVPHIIRHGADWFRRIGTEDSPGTMVFTISGDVATPGIHELPLGTTLRTLLDIAGGPAEGQVFKALFPGASAAVITDKMLDTPMSFDAMRKAGSALGSAGFIAYDDSACMVRALLAMSRFLYVESCAQCPACKHGTGAITEILERIEDGKGRRDDVETLGARIQTVTDGQRCALPTGEALLVGSVVEAFADEFAEHLGRDCPRPRDLPIPLFRDYDPQRAEFVIDEAQQTKGPDWMQG